MKKEFPKQSFIIVGSLLLCIVVLIVAKYSVKPPKEAEIQTVVPAFSSAKFEGGDLLQGLGPEWTYLKLSDLGKSDGNWLDGTVPIKEALVKLVGKDVSMMLIELKVEDQDKLDAALKNPTIKTYKEAGRDGYIVPMNDIAEGTAFALVGTDKVLLIQYGNASQWPDQIESEIANFIANLSI
ncbi:MAG: hypothetical protein ABIB04_01520 [Patescibacteria group bacterium]